MEGHSLFKNRQNKTLFLLLMGFAALTYIIGLFVDVAGDAAKYAAIAKNIFRSGDFINLSIQGLPYDQKPPFMFWLSAVGYALFGESNIGFKFFPVLYTLFGVYCTYKLGQSLYNKKVGIISALLMSFSVFYFLYNIDIHTDLVLLSNVAFALWQLYDYLKKGKTLHFILGFFAVGLAMLSKGPIGAFVPAFAVAVYLLANKKFKQLFHPKWVAGVAIALLTVSPALLGLYNQFGVDGIKFFFWTNNTGRIVGSIVPDRNTDYFFYLHTLLYMYAPWGFALMFAIFHDFKELFKKQVKPAGFFVMGGTWLVFIIISIAQGKSPNYLSTLIPLFSVSLARQLDVFFQKPGSRLFKVVSTIQVATVIILWCFLALLVTYLFPIKQILYYLLFATGVVATIFIYLKAGDDIAMKFFAPSILVITLIMFSINANILPYILQYQSSIVASRVFNENDKGGGQLYNYDYEQFELFFYGNKEVVHIPDYVTLGQVCDHPGSWIYCYEKRLKDIEALHTPIDTIYQFKHRGIYNMGVPFILPANREASFENTYLVKLKDEKPLP